MNRIEKVLSIFLILTVMTVWVSLGVCAEETSQTPDSTAPASTAGTSQTPSAAPQPSPSPAPRVTSSAKPRVSSSSPSRKSYSSRTVRRTVRTRVSSQTASSGNSSEVSGGIAGEISSEPSSSEISLPEVSSSQDSALNSAAGQTGDTGRLNWIGIVAWVCIALGVLVVLIVVFSNRRPPRGMGRKRYRRPRRSRKKRLLNDKYYRNINRY